MKTIHKYQIRRDHLQTVSAPIGWKPLHVGLQDGGLHIWAEVDTSMGNHRHRVSVRGTGHELGRLHGNYLGTVFDHGGLVWHVYVESWGTSA